MSNILDMTRRTKRPIVTGTIASKVIRDGVARCKLTREQLAEFIALCPRGSGCQRVRRLAHEVEIIVQNFWRNNAVFSMTPTDAQVRKKLERLRSLATDAASALKDREVNIIIDGVVLGGYRQRGDINFTREFESSAVARHLDELALRARVALREKFGREGRFAIKSNRHNPPLRKFIFELGILWTRDMEQSLRIHAKETQMSDTVKFCEFGCRVAGHRISPSAVAKHLKHLKTKIEAGDYRDL